MKYVRTFAVAAALVCISFSAFAQWQTPNHSVAVGRGAGVIGFGNAAPGATVGAILVGAGATTDPAFSTILPATSYTFPNGLIGIAGGSNLIPLDVGGRIHSTEATFSNGPVTASQPLQIDFIPATVSGAVISNTSVGSSGSPYSLPADSIGSVMRSFSYVNSPYVADPNAQFTGFFLSNNMLGGTNGAVNGASFNATTGGTWTNPLSVGGAVGLYATATATNGGGDNFSADFITTIPQSVTATRSVQGLEIDINNGSSTGVKLGLATNFGTGANDGGAVTGTYTLSNGGGTVPSSIGWFMQAATTSAGVSIGIGLIGQGPGAWPIASTGTGLLMAGGTAAIGIDLSRNTTWTTAAIKTPGYLLDGSGTITSGTWQGSIVAGQYGGTGVANTGKTITLGGNLATSGAFASTFTMTGTTAVTFPASGTLATTAGASIPAVATGDILYGSGTNALSALAHGTSSQVLIGGVSAPSWGSVTSAMLNITTTTCTNQFITAISATGVGTCTSVTAAETPLTNTHILVGNSSNVATDVTLSGDATITNTGVITVNKSNGTGFGTAAFQNTGTSGANIPFLNGANTWSGAQTFGTTVAITPTAVTTTQGLYISQTGPNSYSTGSDNFYYNLTTIGNDQITASAGNVSIYGSGVTLAVGGASTGSHVAFISQINHNVASVDTGDTIGGVFTAAATVNAGGTNTGAGANGTNFAGGLVSICGPGATNYFECAGAEIDVGVSIGASTKLRLGLSVVSGGGLQGAAFDAAYEIGAVSLGWHNGLFLANFHGFTPLDSGGCVICTDGSANTIAKGFDLSSYTLTSYFLRGPASNFSVDQSGNVVGANMNAGGTLLVTGATTLSAALTYGGVALSNLVTGTGSMVLSNSPALVTPSLGTPTSGIATNLTGLPTSALTGVLLAAQGPAHTGDVTNSAGSLVLTLATAQPAVHTWALTQTFTVAPVFTDQSGSRTALGLGTMATQAASAVAITGGTIAGLTGLAIRDTSATFDVTIAATATSATLTAGRTLTLDVGNVAHTLKLGTTAGTITFPNTAADTVAMLAVAQTFTARQIVSGISNDAIAVLSGDSSSNSGISVGRTAADGYLVAIGTATGYNPVSLQGDTVLRGQSRILLDGSGGGTNAIIIGATNTLTLSTVASDAATTDNSLCVSATGLVLKGSGTLGICLGTSGAQFKTAIVPMLAGIDEISRLKLSNYRYREGYGDGGARTQYGMTAQDVSEVMPDLVRYDEHGVAINFDLGAFLPVSLHALQQLNERIAKLENHK
jgi:hypothetical protein